MNLFYFKRLLVKRSGLILGTGIIMAGLVFMFTRNLGDTYTASSTIYAGIRPGYENGEGVNTRFNNRDQHIRPENLIHILKSRETAEKSAIRLMARHLMLTKPDPALCLPETWQALMTEIPDEVEKIVVRIDQSAKDTVQNADIKHETQTISTASIIKVKKFRVKKEYYTLKAGDTPDEICMRFGLYMDELTRMNNPMPPFQGGQRLVVRKVSESYWVDSIIPAQKPVRVDTAEILPTTVNNDELRYEKLVEGLTTYKNATPDNYIAKTLQSSQSHYGVHQISSVKIKRIRNSDLLKLSFDCTDPGVCLNTLQILTDVLQSQYESLTAGQPQMVPGSFRIHENQSGFLLDSLERELARLQMKYPLNSAGQSQFVQVKKGLLEQDWHYAANQFSSDQTALGLIEQQIGEKGQSVFQNPSLIGKRGKVYDLAFKLSVEEVSDDASIESLTRLKRELERVKTEMYGELVKSIENSITLQELNDQNSLEKWLEKAIEVEESRARYNNLTNYKTTFLNNYNELTSNEILIKKLEHEIAFTQSGYINIQQDLNQNGLKLKSNDRSAIRIVDAPVFPAEPNTSKRVYFTILAFLAGILIATCCIIVFEWVDSSIKTPGRLEKLSGEKLLGVYPQVPKNRDNHEKYSRITSRCIDQMIQRIRLENLRQNENGEKPFLIFMISTRKQEGKTYLATRLVEKLRATGSRVLFVKPMENYSFEEIKQMFSSFDQPQQAWDFEYAIPDHFVGIKTINELMRNYTFLTSGYQYLFIELPALLSEEFPAVMAKSGNLSIMVAHAGRSWNQTDADIMDLYRSTTGHSILGLLNGCRIESIRVKCL